MRRMTKEWLNSAHIDLETIESIINNENLTGVVAFHSQQAIEKLLKALFEEYEIEIPKIHKLIRLSVLLAEKIEFLEEIWDERQIKVLDELYIDSRYPGELGLLPNGKPTIEDACGFYEIAKIIYKKIYEKVSA